MTDKEKDLFSPLSFSSVLGLLLAILICSTPVLGLDGKEIKALKDADVGDGVIAAMIAEKSVETAAFKVQDILEMRQAGISNELIQQIITAQSFMRNRQPVIYGQDIKPLKLSTANDLIRLKQAGFDDRLLIAIIDATDTRKTERERRQAMEFLSNAGFLLDMRHPKGP